MNPVKPLSFVGGSLESPTVLAFDDLGEKILFWNCETQKQIQVKAIELPPKPFNEDWGMQEIEERLGHLKARGCIGQPLFPDKFPPVASVRQIDGTVIFQSWAANPETDPEIFYELSDKGVKPATKLQRLLFKRLLAVRQGDVYLDFSTDEAFSVVRVPRSYLNQYLLKVKEADSE